LLQQLCRSSDKHRSDISPEPFLSAFVEEQLGEMFLSRERRKGGKTKKTNNAVQSAKERAKTCSEAVVTTQTALEAMPDLFKGARSRDIVETTVDPVRACPCQWRCCYLEWDRSLRSALLQLRYWKLNRW
jgi:hypothetical protein